MNKKMDAPMKIVSLTVENVMRLKAVEMTPDGALVVVGGKNKQGKSSLFHAIEYALGGTRGVCDEPVRRGKDTARIVIDLGDLVVTRTFTKGGGGSFIVKGRDGEKKKSPQTILDRLTNRLTFNPLAFMAMGRAEQQKLLLELVGIDFSKLDKRLDSATDQRREYNKDVKRRQAIVLTRKEELERSLEEAGVVELPASPLSLQDVEREFNLARSTNEENENERKAYQAVRKEYTALNNREKELNQELAEIADKKAACAKKGVEMKKQVESLVDADIDSLSKKFNSVSAINEAIRLNEKLQREITELAEIEKTVIKLDDEIKKDIPKKRDALMATAKMPIENIGFGDGVTYEGMPFDQCSDSDQIRISVAIGVAMNPKLRVFFIRRDGSLLDTDNLALLEKLAIEYDAQVWVERVSEGDECQVIIEDGQIVNRS